MQPAEIFPPPLKLMNRRNQDKPQFITKLRLKLLEDGRPAYKIAEEAGIHPSHLSNYQMGKKKIPAKHLFVLCQVFECYPEDLVGSPENIEDE